MKPVMKVLFQLCQKKSKTLILTPFRHSRKLLFYCLIILCYTILLYYAIIQYYYTVL